MRSPPRVLSENGVSLLRVRLWLLREGVYVQCTQDAIEDMGVESITLRLE